MSSLSRGHRSRGQSLQQQDSSLNRNGSNFTKKQITVDDAYSYALRSAFLTYILQPRQKRLQHVAAPAAPKPVQKSSAMELLTDFSGSHGGKAEKFPHDFMRTLDKRATNVLMGKERLPEFNDANIKRSFGGFLNEFKEPTRRRNLEKDRKMEDLLLIFYSSCVKELRKGKAPDDDSWKFMGDRHLALFIRLITSIMKDNEWEREKPELTSRLHTLEKKLLLHDLDLSTAASRGGGAGGHTIEVEVPLSYEVKDMPLVLVVARIFDKLLSTVQQDINQNKSVWTEEAALKDLKMYQQSISLKARNTINADDFDTDEAYDAWKKNEIHDVSQMLFSIIQSHPALAKTSTGSSLPLQAVTSPSETAFSELSRKISEQSDMMSTYTPGQDSFDFSAMNLNSEAPSEGIEIPFIYIPPQPRSYYREVIKQTLIHNIRNPEPNDPIAEGQLLSRKSHEVLEEIAARWRIPLFSRRIVFLEAIRDLYIDRDIGLQTIETAFIIFKEVPQEKKKTMRRSININLQDMAAHWTKWTLKDVHTYQQSLVAIRDNILRDLFQILQGAYDAKSPSFGLCLAILYEHLLDDELLPSSTKPLDDFATSLSESLRERAAETYQTLLTSTVPTDPSQQEFYHVIKLGQEVVKLCEKIQKRFKKAADMFGAKPLTIFVKEALPAFARDAKTLVSVIMSSSKQRHLEIPVEDGFQLYKELVEIRSVYNSALPGQRFTFQVEEQLQEFVWRWIDAIDSQVLKWVEGAVKEDQFRVGSHAGNDQRHSVSVIDVFRSFKQSKDEIALLGWDDDYQRAKFMTAIAKAIGVGVARYCDLLDQQFTKEMSRLTPEQEAALTHTRQEKWIQIAKDTFSNKDHVEPYQFLPESLVKLNNIEYAMQRLDKLEQEMEVDKCAAIIRARGGSDPRTRGIKRGNKMDKYVFTIKIIEGEDLKACDMNGLSDPYVVLGDEYQKRLAKTRIVYGSLNPRWDETIDIVTQGPLNIIATIWDWDQLGDHDCVGRTSLKLEPSHFWDFTPREYWLDLDTQGRLLLRVSMEGERDDIEFHFGKAFRSLKRTERDMTRTITDKLSAYIRHILSRQRLKSLLSKGYSVSSALSYFNRGRSATSNSNIVTQVDIENAISPLYAYFDENFAIMKETLTDSAMIMVMTRLWKEVLITIEGLLVPPMSDKLSQQKALTQQELDVVFKWLQFLFDFFHAVDEETGSANGVPLEILKSPKYHEILNLNFFYFESTEDLIRTSEGMAAASATRHQEQVARLNRLSAPASMLAPPSGHSFGGAAGLVGTPVRRRKTVMLSRNLGTMRKAKEEKRKAAQAEPTDEYILRILRMRPEAERYLRDRARQKERLAAAQAAEAIVRQSLAGAGSGRMLAGYTGGGGGGGR